MRLIQILGDDLEELYNIPSHITDEQVEKYFREYKSSEDYSDFEEFMAMKYEEYKVERMFVDEIYID